MQLNHSHIRRGNTLLERIRSREADNSVSISIRRRPVDDIYQAILQPAGRESVDDMGNQRPLSH
jgi:hypothetical protein